LKFAAFLKEHGFSRVEHRQKNRRLQPLRNNASAEIKPVPRAILAAVAPTAAIK
jgi:hypothetical protein